VPPWDWRKSEKENAPGWRTAQFEGKSAVLILGENQLSNVSAEYRFFRGRMSRMPEFTHIEVESDSLPVVELDTEAQTVRT
jgi:hypothetical protein